MLKTDALQAYDNNVKAVAAALDITISAVYQWGEIVPPHSAMRLAMLRPDLRYDPEQYRNWYAKFGRRKGKSRRH